MNQIEVGSRIVYQVKTATTFLFNISVDRNEHPQVVEESFNVEPYYRIEECAISPLGNRLVRLSVPPSDLTVSYHATVNLNVEQADTTRLAPVVGFVRIGIGRDAADVAFSTIRGNAQTTEIKVWANEQQHDDELLDPNNVKTAVSSA